MKKVIFAAIFALVAVVAQASSVKDLESSAVIDGSIVVTTDGSVRTTQIDEPEKYGPIAEMVRNAALKWRFQPVLRHGEPVVAKASMHVRVVVKKLSEGRYAARVTGATFGDDDPVPTDELRYSKSQRVMPVYPAAPAKARVDATVYVVLRVDRSGHVADAVAEQVNLGSPGAEVLARRYRRAFAEAALKATRRWTFEIPTTGELAASSDWTARIPIHFHVESPRHADTVPVWQTYVPGPYTPAPWAHRQGQDGGDAIAEGALQTEGTGPVLLSKLDQG